MTRVAFIGVGKLGLPVSMVMAKNHDVVGYDVSRWPYDVLASRVFPHPEAEAQEYLNTTTLRMVDSIDAAVAHGDLIFVAVQTPHGPEYEGSTRIPETRADFDYSYLKKAVSDIAECAKVRNKKVVVCVISTVLPGTVNREIRPLLNEHVAFCYSPYFIAMSTVIPDFVYPEFVLLGADKGDEDAADIVREFYGTITKSPVRQMSVASAEATKVFYNTFISTKITLVNTYMQVCEATGANVDDVTEALCAATSRIISPKYMRAGLGDGGGCFVEGSMIHTEDGVCQIEDIQKGDKVLGNDGLYHEVLETYRRPYKGKVYTLKGRGLTRFTVTGEHPIHAARDLRRVLPDGRRDQNYGPQLGKIEEIKAADIQEDCYIAFPTPRANSERDEWTPPRGKSGPAPRSVDTSRESYVLVAGYYMAEGNIWFDKNKNFAPMRVNFSFNTLTDGDYVAELVRCLKEVVPGAPIRVATTNERESCTEVRVDSTQLAKILDHDCGHGYEDKFVPRWILNHDRNSSLCLRALFRGDGSSHDEGLSFSTVSPHLAHGVSLMLRRHGVPSALQYHPKRVGKDGVVHRAAYDLGVNNAAYIERLAEIVGMPIRHKMQDKRYPNTIFERDGYWYHYVNSIETSDYEGTVYNLNVADVHNYVSVGGLVSNCHPRDNIALSHVSDKLGFTYNIFDAIMKAREEQTAWLASFAVEEAKRAGLNGIVILGKAFKGGTNMVVGSPAVLLKNILTEHAWVKAGHLVHQVDHHVDGHATFWTEPAAFIVATDHPEFYKMTFPAGSIVIDPWGKMPDTAATKVIRVGRH